MSSLVEYCRDTLDAKLLLTFTGSAYDRNGFTTQHTDPFIIPDDSNYSNHADAYDFKDAYQYPGYRLDGLPLPEKASDEEHSFQFLGYVNGESVKTILAVEATGSLFLTNKEYTLMFFYADDTSTPLTNGSETIFSRQNLFSLTRNWNVGYYDNKNFNIVVKNTISNTYSTYTLSLNTIIGMNVIKIKQEGTTLRAYGYCNGILTGSNSWDVGSLVIDISNTSTTYIGGLPTNVAADRMRRTARIQYIGFYDYAMNDVQIAGLLKRAFSYLRIHQLANPTILMTCQDTDIINTKSVALQKGSGSMSVYGDLVKGSTKLDLVDPTLTSIYFAPDCSLMYRYGNSSEYPAFFNGSTFTIEMWFRTTNTSSCVLACLTSIRLDGRHPLTIKLNRASGQPMTGSVEVSDEYNSYANSLRGQNFTDGKWHHIQVKSTTKTIELILDGVPHGNYIKVDQTNRIFTDLSLMADSNNRNSVVGDLAFFAFTNTVNTSIFDHLKYSYSMAYIIKGRTTISGASAVSDVRVYDYEWGHFLQELKTKPTGDYTIYLNDSRRVIVNVMILGDTRYNPKSRVVSPMIISDNKD